jgi:hypothetical protein
MKTINKTRSTSNFCIHSGHLHALAKIGQRFGRQLVCVAYDNSTEEYTVRVAEDLRLVDYRITVLVDVRILEETLICKLSKYASK